MFFLQHFVFSVLSYYDYYYKLHYYIIRVILLTIKAAKI